MECCRIKGIKNGFRIVVSQDAPFEELIDEITEKVGNTMELFRLKKELVVEVERGNLTHENKCEITKKLLNMLDFKAIITFIDEQEIEKRIVQDRILFRRGI